MRALGIEAYSCDIMPCSGGHPEWHIEGDVTHVLNQDWDIIISFPPCTHLAVSGARWFEQKRKDGRQQQGIDFFMMFIHADCDLIAVENPVSIMSSVYRKPDQIIQPFEYGDPYPKSTCLWLKGLPLLVPTNIVDKGERVTYASGKSVSKWSHDMFNLPAKDRSVVRSKTPLGIAKAMASQWGPLVEEIEV
jgi:site-specific DNA-cytosine methylase